MRTHYKPGEYTLSMEKISQLINSAKTFRDRLIIESLYFPALRRFEVANMRIENINFDNGVLTIVGKGNSIDPVPVGSLFPQYISDLKHFIGSRKFGFVFMGNTRYGRNVYPESKHIDISRINQMLAQTAELVGISSPNPKRKHINCHLLRHSLARHLKNLGFTAEFIQKYLRHSSIKTTMDTYGTLSLEEMQKIAADRRRLIESH
jgi:integrase